MSDTRAASRSDDDAVARAYDGVLVRRMLAFLRPHRGWVAIAVVLLLVTSALELLGPYLTKVAIDDHVAHGDLDGLARIALLFLAVVVGGFALEYVQFYVMQWVGQHIVLELRRRILAHLQAQELAYYDRNPVGRLMTRVMGDVQALHELFTSGVVAIFGDFVTLVGIVVAMFLLDWRLALVANLVLPALIAISLLFRARVRRSYAEIRTRVAAMNAFLQEHLTGMRVVQLFGREAATGARFAALNAAHRDVQLRTVGYYALFFPAIEFVSAVALALILASGGRRVGSEGLQLGLLIAFMQYAERFFRPISDLSEKYNTFQAAMASAERIFGLLDRTATIRSPAQPIRLHRARGHIVFEHVDFAYDPREPVLRDVSFEVRPGEKLAIVGATGAGKTSILSVLTRLYEIQSGRVLLDGVDIRELELQDLRRQVGVVLQEVFLFAGNIAGNIRLGDDSIGIERVREAARLASADRFITRLPQGYDTVLGERGSSISVGEKQLLALARVLAFDPAVVVLDEATASVDTETELLIRAALRRVLSGRAGLVVAHRLSTIQDCDRILVLHKGEVRETGTHEELLQRDGLYARLHELQFRDQPAA